MGGGKKHGPNRLDSYLDIHSTVMQKFVSGGFVLRDGLLFEAIGDGTFTFTGEIECVGEIVVRVSKILAAVGDPSPRIMVETVAYSYNAMIPGLGNILRYDSPHPTHNRFHHVHRYEVLRGDTDGTVDQIPDDGWPTLGELLGELQEWYYTNYDRLSELGS